jgi:hydrogenase maturation protease
MSRPDAVSLACATPARVAPTLVIAIGNPSRGDDAIGPLVAERLQALGLPDVEVLTDFQLQVEYLLDLMGRSEVVFVDASVSAVEPFEFAPLQPHWDPTITTHAMSPASLLEAYPGFAGEPPPPARVAAIRGYSFELGAPLSARAAVNLKAAFDVLVAHLEQRRMSTLLSPTHRR